MFRRMLRPIPPWESAMPLDDDDKPKKKSEKDRIEEQTDQVIGAMNRPRFTAYTDYGAEAARFNALSLDDEGTRWAHFSQLVTMWEEGQTILEGRPYRDAENLLKTQGIKIGIALLKKTMEGMSGYRDRELELRKLIDFVPSDVSSIPSGRGTPLKPWGPGVEDQG